MKTVNGFLNELEIVLAMAHGEVVVTPIISKDQIGPTVDLRLGTEFIIKKMEALPYFDPVKFNRLYRKDPEQIMRFYEIVKRVEPDQEFILHPNQFAISCTMEYIHFSPSIGAQLEGKSSWAREGLNVHSTAGLIHAGHSGIIVLELHNVGTHPIALYPGTKVAQLMLYRLNEVQPASAYAAREGAKYSKYVATNIGRPWEDQEYAVLSSIIDPAH
jgi:dCTP deaminase